MAKFEKGNPGKPKGAENKVTKEARELVLELVSDGLEKAKQKLEAIQDPKEYLETLAKFISYVVPKQRHTEISGEVFEQPLFPDVSHLTFEELYQLKHGNNPAPVYLLPGENTNSLQRA